MKQIKKLLSVLLVLAMVIAHVPSVAVSAEIVTAPGGSADFNAIQSTGSTSYGSHTTTNGWTIVNSAIHVGGTSDSGYTFNVVGPNNSYKAPCLNGKTTAAGKLTSPTLTTGISKLTINYTKMFTDTDLSVTVTVKDAAGNTYTHVAEKRGLTKNEKYVVYTDEWTLDTPVVGNFTIEVVNNCPSNSTSNKDRITILSLAWDGAVNSGNEGGSGGDEGGSEPEEPTKFDVSFDLNGAEGDAPDAIQVEEGKAYGELPAPTREGYTFVGWFTEAACTNAVNAETIVTQSHTLYAKWSKNPATHVDPATVTYTYGSTGSYSNIIKNWGIRGDVATALSVNATAFYTGDNTYAKLSAMTGSATLSTVPQSDLYVALKTLMASKHTKTTTYDQVNDLLAFTDCQNGDDSTISLFYSGESVPSAWDSGTTFNKEHCWPKSLTEGSDSTVGVDADIMTLRATKPSHNSSRGDKPYGTASGSFNPNTFANGKYDLRGDCARILLYTYVRWGEEELNAIDSVDVLLSWIQADPVDSWELARNDSVQSITGTRNVFVDYPQLAFILFGEEVPSDLTVPNDGAEADPEPTPDPTPDPAPGGSADFNALVINTSSGGDTGYGNTYSTANGWQTVNSAILVGGTSNSGPAFTIIGSDKTQKAVCLNGKTSAPGKLTSPVLTTGISKLTIKYTMPFTDTNLSVTVTIKDATGNVHDTHVIEKLRLSSADNKLKLFEDEWELQTPLAGAFTIEVVNNCPSGNSTTNKDRFAILSLDWEGVASEEVPEIVIFDVSFDLNGAEGDAPATKQVVEGAAYGTLPAPTREDYDFDGWCKTADGSGEIVTADTIVTGSHTLYAKWTPKPVATVSFDLCYEGATGTPESVNIITGRTYKTLPEVAREGYNFVGWYKDADGSGQAVKAEDVVSGTHTLYAKWIRKIAIPGETIQITIDFSTTDQRTGFSEEQQVWANEGLTFTNNKAGSSNAMGDYPNDSNAHVRLYKNSEVIIACEGMLQIQVVSEGGSEYKNAFADALTAAGLCYILNGNTFTIFLAEPTDTLTIPMDGGQARLKNIAVSVCAPLEEDTIPDYFTYSIDGTNLTITGYSGTEADLVIESNYTIGGAEYTVTGIGDGAFKNCSSLTSISIPDGVTSIGNWAFCGCGSLVSIRIPDSVISVGYEAFTDCAALTYNTYDNGKYLGNSENPYVCLESGLSSSITAITVHPSTKVIGPFAFFFYLGLKEITIPDSVVTIGEEAFSCTALETVYYDGTDAQKTAITIKNEGNAALLNATWYCNFDSTDEGTSDIVNGWGLTLNDEIVANFKMTFTPEILADEQAYVEVKVGDKVTEVPVSEVNGPLQVAVYATQMNDKITLCVVDGNSGRSEENTFTIRQYCETILASQQYAQYHQLVKEMLNYGGAAQAYFGHNTDELASEGIIGAGQVAVPESSSATGIRDQIEDLKCIGATLVYRDKIALRYYFEGSLEGYTFSAIGAASTPIVNVEGGYVEIADILPQNLDVAVTLEVEDAQGNLLQVDYCPMNYITRMNQKGSEATKALVKALYNYYLAAKAFVNK